LDTELYLDTSLRLGAATLCGLLIGINRDTHEKPAGMRTLGLVALGAALVTMSALQIHEFVGEPDAMSRVLQGVIQGVMAGIGFIGAGTIMRLGRHGENVQGVTTAASVWTSAALGIACGMGQWPIVVVGMVLVFLILVVAKHIENWLLRQLLPDGEKGHPDRSVEMAEQHPADAAAPRGSSSKGDTGSREENATRQEPRSERSPRD
jgi:putative Mg2+ transporter-C (MgtC) family protein